MIQLTYFPNFVVQAKKRFETQLSNRLLIMIAMFLFALLILYVQLVLVSQIHSVLKPKYWLLRKQRPIKRRHVWRTGMYKRPTTTIFPMGYMICKRI